MDNTYQVTVAFNWEATVALDNEIKVSSNEFGIEVYLFLCTDVISISYLNGSVIFHVAKEWKSSFS